LNTMLIFVAICMIADKVVLVILLKAKAILTIPATEPTVALNRFIAFNAGKFGECRMAWLVNLE